MAASKKRIPALVAPAGTKVAAFLLALVVALASGAALARKAQDRGNGEDSREVQGRALFAKGDYQAALDIYATLFAEKSDPIYLRNIGRCHQKLEQPKNAINAFREYLRRSKVKPAERAEVDGFIQEMEELQKRQAATTPPPPADVPASAVDSSRPPAVSAPPPPAPPVAETPASHNAPGATLTREAAPVGEPSGSERSIATRWWFWTGVAVLVAGGAATAFALTSSSGGLTPPCPTDSECPLY